MGPPSSHGAAAYPEHPANLAHPAESDPRSDSAMRVIRAALTLRGTSFRAWVQAWVVANGRDPAASYETARATVTRRLQRGLPS